MSVRPCRPDRLDHEPDQLVGDRRDTRCAGQAAASAAATYRRAVLRSTPARSATFLSPWPSSHARSTSRTSTTLTYLNPTLDDLRVHEHDAVSQRGDQRPTGQARRVVP